MLRKYVRQLRPLQEKYVLPIDKVQTLLREAQLKKADIFKRDNQNKFVSLAKTGELTDKSGKKLPKSKRHRLFTVLNQKCKRPKRYSKYIF